nr:hypothetical protein [Pandoravirus massiliensis]
MFLLCRDEKIDNKGRFGAVCLFAPKFFSFVLSGRSAIAADTHGTIFLLAFFSYGVVPAGKRSPMALRFFFCLCARPIIWTITKNPTAHNGQRALRKKVAHRRIRPPAPIPSIHGLLFLFLALAKKKLFLL